MNIKVITLKERVKGTCLQCDSWKGQYDDLTTSDIIAAQEVTGREVVSWIRITRGRVRYGDEVVNLSNRNLVAYAVVLDSFGDSE